MANWDDRHPEEEEAVRELIEELKGKPLAELAAFCTAVLEKKPPMIAARADRLAETFTLQDQGVTRIGRPKKKQVEELVDEEAVA